MNDLKKKKSFIKFAFSRYAAVPVCYYWWLFGEAASIAFDEEAPKKSHKAFQINNGSKCSRY